jgi:ribose transport system permease protein
MLRNSLQRAAVLWALITVFVLLSVSTDNFLSIENLRNILDQQAFILIIAAFATIVIIAGGFDVSLGAIFVLAPIVALKIENSSGSVAKMLIAGMLVGLICGVINGLIVAFGKINSFISTLATSFIIFGIAYLVSNGAIISLSNFDSRIYVTKRILGVTSATWIAALVLLFAWLLLERAKYGRHIFAIGGNLEAAQLAGVRVSRVQIIAFTLGGFGAGLAGSLNALRTTSAQASDDFSVIFAVIAAIVVGGTSIAGGSGAIWRSIAGVFFIAMLVNGFNLNGVDPVFQRIIQGLVILLAVGADNIKRLKGR